MEHVAKLPQWKVIRAELDRRVISRTRISAASNDPIAGRYAAAAAELILLVEDIESAAIKKAEMLSAAEDEKPQQEDKIRRLEPFGTPHTVD